jgi:hypothetical protein
MQSSMTRDSRLSAQACKAWLGVAALGSRRHEMPWHAPEEIIRTLREMKTQYNTTTY